MRTMKTATLQRRAATALATGTLDGLFSGMTGVGGGAILVPLLVSILRLGQHKAHGTSLSIIAVVGLFSALEYYRQGHMDLRMAATLAVGSLVGVVLGASAMTLIPALLLRRIFGVFLLLVAIRMLTA